MADRDNDSVDSKENLLDLSGISSTSSPSRKRSNSGTSVTLLMDSSPNANRGASVPSHDKDDGVDTPSKTCNYDTTLLPPTKTNDPPGSKDMLDDIITPLPANPPQDVGITDDVPLLDMENISDGISSTTHMRSNEKMSKRQRITLPLTIQEEFMDVENGQNDPQQVDSDGDFDMVDVDSFNFDSGSDMEDSTDYDESRMGSGLSSAFNVHLVTESIERSEPVLKQVEGRDVVLIVGKTGVGKSTLIQAIAGRTLQETEHLTQLDQSEEVATKTVYEAVDPMIGFEIGHEKMSKTTCLSCFDSDGKNLLFIDTPGFEDTNGHEVDIATSVMLTKVADRCRSLRFVIMINCVSLLEDRGSAMRTLLKFIRTLAKDFEKEKQSFMFLFTHSNEIKDIPPNSIDGAKKWLQNEIIRTIASTSDEGTKTVLKHLKNCLKKGYQFIDMFLPLETDIPALHKFILTKLKPSKDPYLAKRCGLTPACCLALSGALQSQYQHLCQLLASEHQIDCICKILNIFCYFERYVNIEDVRNLVCNVKDRFLSYIRSLNKLIQDEVKRGTSFDSNFGPSNINSIKCALSKLNALKDKFPDDIKCDHTVNIHQQLMIIQNDLMLKDGQIFTGVHPMLAKMQVWSDGFSDFQTYYEVTKKHLNSVIERALSNSAAIYSIPLLSLSDDQVESQLVSLTLLRTVNDDAENLSGHLSNVKEACGLYQSIVQRFQSEISSKKELIQSECDSIRDERGLLSVFQLLNLVTIMDKTMDTSPICSALKDDLVAFKKDLVENMEETFQQFASQVEEKLVKSPQEAYSLLHLLKFAIELSTMNHSLLRLISDFFNSSMAAFESHFMKYLGELEEITRSTERHGIKNGIREAESFMTIQSFNSFDTLLPTEDKYIENYCIEFQRIFDERMEHVSSEISLLFGKLEDPSLSLNDSKVLIEELNEWIPEMEQIQHFAKSTGNSKFSNAFTQTREKIQNYIHSFCQNAREICSQWRNDFYDLKSVEEIDITTRKVNSILGKIEVLQVVQLHPDLENRLSSLHSFIENLCRGFSNRVKNVMKDKGHYPTKLHFFDTFNALCKYSHVAQHLPDLRELQDLGRNSVANDAKVIEDKVSESSNWNEIDALLAEFEGATVLDHYTSKEASSRIRPLFQLKEKKQDEVNNLLEDLIQNEDFKGIREFLIPYSNSKDQVQKQRFSKWRDMIVSTLHKSIKVVKQSLQSDLTDEVCSIICSELDKIQYAETEIGQHLQYKRSVMNLQKEIDSLSKDVNSKVASLLDDFDSAVRNLNYFDLGFAKLALDANVGVLDAYISVPNRQRLKTKGARYYSMIENVSEYMTSFFQFELENDRSDFFRVLSTLKKAKECDSPPFTDLRKLYLETKMSLVERFNDMFDRVSNGVEKSKNYDEAITVMATMKRLLSQPQKLKEHVNYSELSFNCEDQLQQWREERDNIDNKIEFDGMNAEEKLKEWGALLSKLQPASTHFFGLEMIFSRWGARNTTYERKTREAIKIVSDRYSRGVKALNDHNHRLVNECINILHLIEKYVGQHVKGAGKKGNDLQDQALNCFLKLCKDSQSVLQSDNKLQFEVSFAEYRGFVLEVPCVMASRECVKAFSLTNQLICDVLEKDREDIVSLLGNHKYETSKQKIENARKFGDFAADRCTILMEEMKSCVYIQEVDPWLLKIYKICQEHFKCGRNFTMIKYFAALELPLCASLRDIKRAHSKLAKKYHPDKTHSNDSEKFRAIQEAYEKLQEMDFSKDDTELPFGALIKGIRSSLREKTRKYLDEQSYTQMEKMLFRLDELNSLKILVRPNLNIDEIQHEIYGLVKSHVQKAKIDIESNWSAKNYRALNDTITDLQLMESSFKSYNDIFPSSWDNGGILKKVEDEIEKLGSCSRDYLSCDELAKKNIDDFRRCFLTMGHVLVELPLCKDFTKGIMCSVLETCLKCEWGYSFLFEFGLSLQRGDENDSDEDKHVAQILVAEFSHFKEVMTMVWNEETSQKPAEDTVDGIKAKLQNSGRLHDVSVDKDKLLQSYRSFDSEYKKLLGEYIEPEADLTKLVYATNKVIEKLRPINFTSGWDESVKEEIPSILAAVFTVFTVLKSGASYNRLTSASSTESAGDMGKKLLMKPHNIQVLTLLSLFGCGSPSKSGLESQLMQIRTGEGKSMILGAAAVILALLGFRVGCVCYSEYLSNRDYHLFQDVFDKFSVTEFVSYSKITTLSENIALAKGDIRGLTESLLRQDLGASSDSKLGSIQTRLTRALNEGRNSLRKYSKGSNSGHNESRESNQETPSQEVIRRSQVENSVVSYPGSTPNSERRKHILLVDEVDVLFGADFYGQTYNQVVQIREPEITTIITHIWNTHNSGGQRQRLADIQRLSAYSKLVQKMPRFKFVIDTEIKLMIDQVGKVNEEPYYHLDRTTGRIGYRIMDSVCYEVTYGYRTVFAYLREADKGYLKNSILENTLALSISCGQFSYANLSPERVLGVSGTLSALGDYEYDVLSRFGLNNFMFIPSVYGESSFLFDRAGDGIKIEDSKSNYFHSITDQIRIITKDEKRAVVVFFENNERMNEFTSSSFYPKLGRQKKLLKEDQSAAEKEFIIRKAATSGQITISTAVFGRGTDFFCKDDTVQKNGGVHVIQTFLSQEKSEEIQIQGRTARQGKKGSYQMVILKSDLEEKFQLKNIKEEVPKKDWYQRICNARCDVQKQLCQTIEESLADATEKDKESHQYFDALLAKDSTTATKLFEDLYKSFKKSNLQFCRLVCLSDATGSMSGLWEATRQCIREMLQRVEEIGEGKFELLWIAYQDYSDASVLKKSNWSKDPQKLSEFLGSVTTGGGGDYEEAVELAMKEANDEHEKEPISRVVLIGDAPPHHEGCGNPLSQHAHVLSTDYKVEAKRFQDNGVPVYTFRLGEERVLKETFNYIASQTGGESHRLEINGSNSNKLIDIVCENALEEIGGSELVAEYRARHCNM